MGQEEVVNGRSTAGPKQANDVPIAEIKLWKSIVIYIYKAIAPMKILIRQSAYIMLIPLVSFAAVSELKVGNESSIVQNEALNSTELKKPTNIFKGNLEPAPVNGSFKMKDYIIWGASVTKGDDGNYYMFASRWPKSVGMGNWVTNSEVVLASSDNAEGPYTFEKVILPPRGPEFWDGMMTHNPTIQRHDGKYILFYIGTTYDFEIPSSRVSRELYGQVWNRKRIGVAVADSPFGPWQRFDEPILQPRPGQWDGAIISNPAPVVREDGSVLLIYKSAPVPYPARNKNRALHFGVAQAPHYLGPYSRVNGGQKIEIEGAKDAHVEDAYVWEANGHYHMVAKVFSKSLTGETGAGFYSYSKDGIKWILPEDPKAYSRSVVFSDGTTRTQKKLERPQVLFEEGAPTHVFFATANPTGGDIHNLVIPLKKNTDALKP
ncbi:Unannotated [Lentimonas sp. CC11]|nr:Unannotated [Lentimonas sp. CC10]CAA7071716.1 Unannotated [Lentimonas sp. CC11]